MHTQNRNPRCPSDKEDKRNLASRGKVRGGSHGQSLEPSSVPKFLGLPERVSVRV